MIFKASALCGFLVVLSLGLALISSTSKQSLGTQVSSKSSDGDPIALKWGSKKNYLKSSSHSFVNSEMKETLALLNEITASPYFRYFKTNIHKKCPFWAVELLCTSENTCKVCKCDENSVPSAFRTSIDMSDVRMPNSFLTQSAPYPENLDSWGTWLNVENDTDSEEYIDLVQNPEGNTGFSGPQASSVWKAIFDENCLSLETRESCRALSYPRILFSGLHTSILLHVATNYYRDINRTSVHLSKGLYNNPNISYHPNCNFFLNRVSANQERLENVYVLLTFIYRAISLTKDAFLGNMSLYNSGDNKQETDDDAKLKKYLTSLYNLPLFKTQLFDEDNFLDGVSKKDHATMQLTMQNITTLMDCVACEKCRVWSKLESKGLSTAMEIVLKKGIVDLDRAEKVALINLARQISFSIRSIEYMSELCNR